MTVHAYGSNKEQPLKDRSNLCQDVTCTSAEALYEALISLHSPINIKVIWLVFALPLIIGLLGIDFSKWLRWPNKCSPYKVWWVLPTSMEFFNRKMSGLKSFLKSRQSTVYLGRLNHLLNSINTEAISYSSYFFFRSLY